MTRIYSDGEVVQIPENSFVFSVGDRAFSEHCKGENSHYCVTVIGEYDFERTTSAPTAAQHYAFLKGPYYEGGNYQVTVPEWIPFGKRTQPVYTLFNKLMESFTDKTEISRLNCAILYIEILLQLSEASFHESLNSTFSPSNLHYANMAVKYINSHVTSPISVNEIADSLGISVGYLSQQFKLIMNCTLVEYINECKINHVKALLINSNTSLPALCRSVSINSESYLSRLFKKYTGVSITDYRKNQQQVSNVAKY